MILTTILIFIIILGILVFVHELGHFVMAKRSGMKVEEFGFGFPPRIFGIKKGETIYSINWIPVGGFVKIMGEDGNDTVNPQSFASKGFWPRFATLIAGVTMNVIFAWVILSIAMGIGLPTVITESEHIPDSAKINNPSIVFSGVKKDSPADVAGLKVGDKILAVNGEQVDSIEEMQTLTKNRGGQETNFTVSRGNESIDKTLTPRQSPPEGEGPLGVSLDVVAQVAYPWYEVPFRGAVATWNLLFGTISAFVTVIDQWLSGNSVGDQLSGPVGIAVLTRDVAQLGFIYLLQFTALLSINLAVVNAVPFPALDGGRILFLVIEKIRGKKLPETAEGVANTIGFALLILLMVFVTVRDFGRFDVIDKLRNLIT
ncbi:MAG: RIP metalloprotease RseP [Candidatus Doudnabacteria bacterium]|nr:RIP metalloprotease RseP [Candidatus Doudnabacteria bacterium]